MACPSPCRNAIQCLPALLPWPPGSFLLARPSPRGVWTFHILSSEYENVMMGLFVVFALCVASKTYR